VQSSRAPHFSTILPRKGGGDKEVGALGNYQYLTFCWQEIETMLVSIPRQFAFKNDSFRFVFL
jgi:hypothetical protein